MSIDDFILKMKQLEDTLMEGGEPISDERLCLYILGGLGSEYESIVVALTNRTEQLTLTDLQYSLQSHELRLQALAAANPDSIQANMANLSLRSSNRGNSRGSRPYNNRGGRGRSQGRSYGQRNRVQCQLCGKFGHTVQK